MRCFFAPTFLLWFLLAGCTGQSSSDNSVPESGSTDRFTAQSESSQLDPTKITVRQVGSRYEIIGGPGAIVFGSSLGRSPSSLTLTAFQIDANRFQAVEGAIAGQSLSSITVNPDGSFSLTVEVPQGGNVLGLSTGGSWASIPVGQSQTSQVMTLAFLDSGDLNFLSFAAAAAAAGAGAATSHPAQNQCVTGEFYRDMLPSAGPYTQLEFPFPYVRIAGGDALPPIIFDLNWFVQKLEAGSGFYRGKVLENVSAPALRSLVFSGAIAPLERPSYPLPQVTAGPSPEEAVKIILENLPQPSSADCTISDFLRVYRKNSSTIRRIGKSMSYAELAHIVKNRTFDLGPYGPLRSYGIFREKSNTNPGYLSRFQELLYASERNLQSKRPRALEGVPFVVKGQLKTKGYATGLGASWVSASDRAQEDAKVVDSIVKAGGLGMGNTSMHELGCGVTGVNPSVGSAHNAFDRERMSGGSSSGVGVAVATRLVPFGIGADAGGSVRIPAAWNGLYGLKPTFGSLSSEGEYPLAPTLSQPGPLARTLRDLWAVSVLMSGQKHYYSGYFTSENGSVKIPSDDLRNFHGAGKPLMIGVPRSWVSRDIEPEILENFNRSLETLKSAGAVVVSIDGFGKGIPKLEWTVRSQILLYANGLAKIPGSDSRFKKDFTSAEVRLALSMGNFAAQDSDSNLSDQDLVRVRTIRAELASAVDQVFCSGIDIIATPTSSITPKAIPEDAYPFGESDLMTLEKTARFTALANLTGHPALSVPIDKWMGLQLIGRPHAERDLFLAAYAYERKTPYGGKTWKPEADLCPLTCDMEEEPRTPANLGGQLNVPKSVGIQSSHSPSSATACTASDPFSSIVSVNLQSQPVLHPETQPPLVEAGSLQVKFAGKVPDDVFFAYTSEVPSVFGDQLERICSTIEKGDSVEGFVSIQPLDASSAELFDPESPYIQKESSIYYQKIKLRDDYIASYKKLIQTAQPVLIVGTDNVPPIRDALDPLTVTFPLLPRVGAGIPAAPGPTPQLFWHYMSPRWIDILRATPFITGKEVVQDLGQMQPSFFSTGERAYLLACKRSCPCAEKTSRMYARMWVAGKDPVISKLSVPDNSAGFNRTASLEQDPRIGGWITDRLKNDMYWQSMILPQDRVGTTGDSDPQLKENLRKRLYEEAGKCRADYFTAMERAAGTGFERPQVLQVKVSGIKAVEPDPVTHKKYLQYALGCSQGRDNNQAEFCGEKIADATFSKLWELISDACEDLNGTYVIQVPFKPNPPTQLGTFAEVASSGLYWSKNSYGRSTYNMAARPRADLAISLHPLAGGRCSNYAEYYDPFSLPITNVDWFVKLVPRIAISDVYDIQRTSLSNNAAPYFYSPLWTYAVPPMPVLLLAPRSIIEASTVLEEGKTVLGTGPDLASIITGGASFGYYMPTQDFGPSNGTTQCGGMACDAYYKTNTARFSQPVAGSFCNFGGVSVKVEVPEKRN